MGTQWTLFWSLKAWWCQPWSVITTGILLLLLFWSLLELRWFMIGITGIILIWWIIFLVLAPTYYRQSFMEKNPTFEERRINSKLSES
uniref:DUF6737 domain-containing protein n=1 Tax=Paulinella micropora TaxID=1928728 RepID=A0A385I1I9_9EUKA|nr:hypothetical protein PMNZ_790 [Paulinella micropora]AXY63710.1 hypothetical protein PMNZ_790 [Paulinella micropora]